MMDGLVGWAMLAVAGASAAVGAVHKLAERRRVRRELESRPALDPDAPEGAVVRVTGVVRAIEPLTAPLTGRACVVYRARADATNWWLRGVSRQGLREEVVVAPFVIDRGDEGTVLIDGTHALLDLEPVELGEHDRHRREHFLLAHGISLREATRARFEEIIVEPGATVSVVGLMMKDPATEAPSIERHFRDAPPFVLRLTGNTEHPIAIGRAR